MTVTLTIPSSSLTTSNSYFSSSTSISAPKVKALSLDNQITEIALSNLNTLSLSNRVPPSSFKMLTALSLDMIKGWLQKQVVRQAHLGRSASDGVSVSDAIAYMTFDSREKILQLEKDYQRMEEQCLKILNDLNEIHENIATKEQALSTAREKAKAWSLYLNDKLDKFVLLNPKIARDTIIEQLPEYISQNRKVCFELEKEFDHLKKVQAHANDLNTKACSNFNNLLLCSFSKTPLKNALIVVTKNETYRINADYLGLKIEKGEIVKDPSKLCQSPKLLKEALVIRRDIALSVLAERVFSLEESGEEIDLDDDSLQDATELDLFKNPMTLECGHTFSEDAIKNVKVCPLCRHDIHPKEAIPNDPIKGFIKAFKDKQTAKEDLKKLEPELKNLPEALNKLGLEIKKSNEESSLFLDIQQHQLKIDALNLKCRQLEVALSSDINRIKALGEFLTYSQQQKESSKLQMAELDEKGKVLLKGYHHGDQKIFQEIEAVRKELIQTEQEHFQKAKALYESCLNVVDLSKFLSEKRSIFES